MNTYDDVKTFGADRYADMIEDAEQDRLVRTLNGEQRTNIRFVTFSTLKLLMVGIMRSIVGKVAQLAARA